jgi:rod shape-determining protein MreC
MQRAMFDATATAASWFLVSCFTIVILIVDRQTDWLKEVRALLSFPLATVYLAAEVPHAIYHSVNLAFEPSADTEAAYQQLRAEYAGLRAEALRIRALERENNELRSLLDASKATRMETKYARVKDISVNTFRQQIVVDKGLIDGAYEGQVAIDETGVVGLVTEVMVNSAQVRLLTDGDVAIPLMFERSGVRTMGIGQGGSTYILKLPFLSRNSDIREGDLLVSSGMGGRYPEGYPVAIVEEISESSAHSFLEITARPVVELDKLAHVLLLSVIQGIEE